MGLRGWKGVRSLGKDMKTPAGTETETAHVAMPCSTVDMAVSVMKVVMMMTAPLVQQSCQGCKLVLSR